MSISPTDMRIIDDLCDRFERAWKSGSPSLEEYLEQAPADCRNFVLCELAAVEMNYRREALNKPCTRQSLAAAHPHLADELMRCPEGQASLNSFDHTVRAVAGAPTVGLQIRCPHCSSPVELVADTPYDEVQCQSCGSEFSLAGREGVASSAPVLQTIGRFELVSRLGMGAFGTVWKARDRELDRTVALKIPRRGQLRPNEVDYFFREARAAAQLRHPHIVAVHEIGREDETVFIVSDFVDGMTLAESMSQRQFSSPEIAILCATIADALHHAHQYGVIHRDLKPSNVMIDQAGEPRIMDFGLAKREAGEVTMTMEGQILGTAAYMSPEQAVGDSHWTDCRTDVYSLGVIIFQLATGELPYRGNLQTQLLAKQIEDAPDPRTLDSRIPQDLATICLKCLERDPNSRYRSAEQLAEELRRFLRGEPINARPISRFRRAMRWAARKPALASVIVLTTFLAVAGPTAAMVLLQQRQRIADQYREQINVIARERQRHQELAGENRALHERIDELLGRVPGIERIAPGWQRALVEQIVNSRYNESAENAEIEPNGEVEQAQFHSALGFLFTELGRQAEALKHLHQAEAALKSALEREPDNRILQRALVECVAAIAKNSGDAGTTKIGARLLDLRKRMAALDDSDVMSLVDLLTSRWKLFEVGDSSGDALDSLSDISTLLPQVVEHWPSAPADVYEAACRLTLREPILSRGIQEVKSKEP